MAAPGFQTWGGNCGAKVFTGGAMQKFDAIRVSVPFDAICVLFINIGFCMFNKLIFFATELSFVFFKKVLYVYLFAAHSGFRGVRVGLYQGLNN